MIVLTQQHRCYDECCYHAVLYFALPKFYLASELGARVRVSW